MKSIKQQYIDLQEGNMTQANFMRNLRMTMPQYVTNLSSFEDSVKILKNKGILTEADTKSSEEGKWKTVTGKDLYGHFKEIDNLNGQEVLIGIDYEMEKNEALTKAEAQKIVIKNLKKIPNYYTNFKISGVEGFEPGYIGGKSANAEARQMHPYAADKVVDKKMGMQPVKNVEKVKKDADAKKETNKTEKGVSLMSLIAKTVRGVKKMDATGEKMKKITVKENKVASTIFDRNANITKGVNTIAKGEEDKAKSVKDKLKELIRKELKEYEAGDESFNISDKEAANEIAYRLIDNLEDNTYTKSQLEDMMMSVEDEAGQHFDDNVFEKAIDILQKRGYSMIFREMFDGMEPMDRTGLD
jgi:hypothetical protein